MTAATVGHNNKISVDFLPLTFWASNSFKLESFSSDAESGHQWQLSSLPGTEADKDRRVSMENMGPVIKEMIGI